MFDMDSEGRALVDADTGLDWDHAPMMFASDGRLIGIDPDFPEDLTPRDRPLVPTFESGQVFKRAWPLLPLEVGTQIFDDGAVTQNVARDGDTWVVTLRRRGMYEGGEQEIEVVMTWEVGRPWWSSIQVAQRGRLDAPEWQRLPFKGVVTSWRCGAYPWSASIRCD